MTITVEKLPKSQVKIVIELTPEATQKFYDKALQQIGQMVKIPGFRPGKASLEVIKKHVDEGKIESHMIDLALPETYGEAVTKEKLQVVSRPQINLLTTQPLKYEATVAIYPEVKLSGYDKISIKKEEVKIEDKEVEEVLKDIQKRSATFKETDQAAKKGDKVEVDFEGFDEGGAVLENTKSTNHPVIIGDGNLIPGFEEELVGLKKDEKKSFTITFPADYFHKKFQSKKVEFKVEVKKVEEVILPEFTPEFLKKLAGEEKTLDEIKATISENLLHDKQHQAKVRRENDFLEKIIELIEVEIPEALEEEEIDSIIEEFKNDLESKGITLQQFLDSNGKQLSDIREQHRKEAQKRLKLRFGLQDIFQKEHFEVTPDELKQEIERMINLYPENERAKIRQEYENGSYLYRRLENKLKMEKLFDRFLGK